MVSPQGKTQNPPIISSYRMILVSFAMSGLYFTVDGSVLTADLFSLDGLVRLSAALTIGGMGLLLINPLFPLIVFGYTATIMTVIQRLILPFNLNQALLGGIFGLLFSPPLLLMDSDPNETILVIFIGGSLGVLCARSPKDSKAQHHVSDK